MKFLLAASLCAACCLPASAQVYLGAEAGPGGLTRDGEPIPPKNHLRRFAGVYAVELGTAAACSLFGSSDPVKEILSLGERGFNRQEVIALAALALERNVPLSEPVAIVEKDFTPGDAFEIYGLDFSVYWRRAAVIKRRLDAAEDALPAEEVPAFPSAPPAEQNAEAIPGEQ